MQEQNKITLTVRVTLEKIFMMKLGVSLERLLRVEVQISGVQWLIWRISILNLIIKDMS
jgi:hypothetical protein